MEKVSLKIIADIMQEVLAGNMSRESAANWGTTAMHGLEEGYMSYEPIEKKEAIWDAIEQLYSIDSMDSPTSYLYSEKELQDFANTLNS